MRKLLSTIVALGISSAAGFAEAQTNQLIEQGAYQSDCFASDAGAGSMDENAHIAWATGKDMATVKQNIAQKIGLITHCGSMSDGKVADFFSYVSLSLARTVTNPNCFASDPGAISLDKDAHIRWALAHSRDEIRQNLQTKVLTAFDCVAPNEVPAMFGNISLQIANARNVVPPQAIAGAALPPSRIPPGIMNPSGLDGERMFFVYMKIAPCSASRTQWLSFAHYDPTGGISMFQEAGSMLGANPCQTASGGCDFATAQATLPVLRASSMYFNYCCKDFSLVENLSTGARSVMVGLFGPPPLGLNVVGPPMCCEQAAVQAGFTEEFCNGGGAGNNNPPIDPNACDMSVWRNGSTGALSIVPSKFGTAGFGWMIVKGGLCCPEAAALAGFPPSFCTGTVAPVAATPTPIPPPPPPPPPPLGPRATAVPGATVTPDPGTVGATGPIGNTGTTGVNQPPVAGALVLVKVEMRGAPDPKVWSIGWDKQSTSGSAQYTNNGATASYQWSVPSQITFNNDIVNISFTCSAGPRTNIAPLIGVGGQDEPRRDDERTVGGLANPNESKDGSKAVPVKFYPGTTSAELRVGVGWSFEAVYTYEVPRS